MMKRTTLMSFAAAGLSMLLPLIASGQIDSEVFPLDETEGLELHNVQGEVVEYDGRTAVRLVQNPDAPRGEDTLAIVTGTDLADGTIELELVGRPMAGAFGGARGFVGVAFRVAADTTKFECFYLRPTNGRAEDQQRRNHSTQYVSHPDHTWFRLREEAPGKYESYVDLEPGVWTKVKIEFRGETARLYVHGADQPCLVVNDLKHGDSRGAIGLWVGPGSETYFTNLRVTSLPRG
jgi:hypothetical protein